MIPILFSENATSFMGFGIGHLPDAISPHVVEERNGEFTLEMQYPIFGEHFSEIGMRSLILAKPSPAQDPQAFRVYRITKPINGIVTISARHLRYDLEGYPVTPFTASGISNALAAIKSHAMTSHNFTFATNKTNTQTMTLKAPTATLSLLGGVQGSLLDIYGGEYKYNNFTINLLSSRGNDNGVVIRYGVDLLDLSQEENCANLYTGVMCYWLSSDGNTLVTGEVQSAGTFSYTRTKVVDQSAKYQTAPTAAQLNQDAVNHINNNNVGVPKVSINLKFANLEQTEEYANIRQSIELCDQITVVFEKLGVSAMAKVIRTDYDVITEKYNSVEIGDSRTSLAETFVAVQTMAENAPTEMEMQQAIDRTTAAITGADGGSVRLLDTNDDGLPDTLYIADNPSPLLASKVWRFNYEGWGASQNGYNGPFTMGATFQQGFIADFITAGTLNADRIGANSIAVSKLTGSITGGLNSSWEIDLDNGTLTIGNLSANNITAGTLNVDRIASNSVGIGKLTGSITNGDWNINLTNGTMSIGTLSADKITSGTIDASNITVTNLNADNITTGSINGRMITDLSIDGTKLENASITNQKIENSTIEGTKIKPYTLKGGSNGHIENLSITGSNIANVTLPGDKLENHTLSDIQLKSQGVSTSSLSSGVTTSLGFADFSNGVFNNTQTASYCHARNITVDSVFSAEDRAFCNRLFVYYGGSPFEATWQQISIPTFTNKTLQVFDGNDQYIGYVQRHYVATDVSDVWVLKH